MSRNNGIPCPDCTGQTEVLETRPNTAGQRRRRKCLVCGSRFFTLEMTVGATEPAAPGWQPKPSQPVGRPRTEEQVIPPSASREPTRLSGLRGRLRTKRQQEAGS